jgi:4-hydroxy-tetrahydrodipicolinate synthase
MTKEKTHCGVVVPMVSPMTSEGTIDIESTERLVDHLATRQVGVFVLGTTGEAASLDHHERLRLVKAAIRAAAGRVPVYTGISDNSIVRSIDAAREYFQAGADACVAHLPCYYKLSEQEMLIYFQHLHAQVEGPLILYNIPQTTHMSLPVAVVSELAELPRIVGIKDSERDVDRMHQIAEQFAARTDFRLYMGSAVLAVRALQCGFDGLVPSSGNLLPGYWRDLVKAARRGEWETAQDLQRKLDAINVVFQEGHSLGQSLWALKVALNAESLCLPNVGIPLQPLTDEEARKICDRITSLLLPASSV